MHRSEVRSERRPKSLSVSKHKTNPSSKPNLYQLQTEICPQVSDFKIQIDPLYTHTMDIDYGKLQRPQFYTKKTIDLETLKGQFIKPKVIKQKQLCQVPSDICRAFVDTQRFITGIKTSRAVQVTNNLPTAKKNIQNTDFNRKEQSSSTKKISNKQKISGKDSKKHIVMRLSDIRALDDNLSQRIKVSNKVIKMIVAGGKVETKLITYPDNSQYLRLCGLNNRKK